MPVLQNFYISHQWLRELKRSGANTFVGIYFKLDSSEKVFAGKYHESHRHITLGEAVTQIQSMDDPLGYELIIDRKIEAREIHEIRYLPQTIGWRYKPGENGKKPCGCAYCQRGNRKGKSIRAKYGDEEERRKTYDEIVAALMLEPDENKIEHLIDQLYLLTKKNDPAKLQFLLERNSAMVDQQFAQALRRFKHKNTKPILLHLIRREDSTTRKYAAESLLELMV